MLIFRYYRFYYILLCKDIYTNYNKYIYIYMQSFVSWHPRKRCEPFEAGHIAGPERLQGVAVQSQSSAEHANGPSYLHAPATHPRLNQQLRFMLGNMQLPCDRRQASSACNAQSKQSNSVWSWSLNIFFFFFFLSLLLLQHCWNFGQVSMWYPFAPEGDSSCNLLALQSSCT